MKTLTDIRADVLGILNKLSKVVPDSLEEQVSLDHAIVDLTRVHYDLKSAENRLREFLEGGSLIIIPPANPSFSGWSREEL